MRKNIGNFVLGASLATIGLYGIAVSDMVAFKAGDPIKSVEVNQNFSSLKSAVQSLESPIGPSRLAVGGTAADGKVLKLQGGKLEWADDQMGSGGGASYTAGTGLNLSGTTFSLADSAVTTAKLANNAVTSDKLAESAVESDHLVNGAVTNNKLANASVTGIKLGLNSVDASKIQLPLTLKSPTANPVLDIQNSSDGPGVQGIGSNGEGVRGLSDKNSGVFGQSNTGVGVQGWSNTGSALIGQSSGPSETLKLTQLGLGALIDARGAGGVTVFSVDKVGNVYSATNSYKSDRNAKTNFESVDAEAVLEKVAAMPITRWSYKNQPKHIQHIGPMAQDFKKAFGLSGTDDTVINSVDVQGVALTAIKGLYQKNLDLEVQNRTLTARMKEENQALKARMSEENQALKAQIKALEERMVVLASKQ